MEFPATPGLLEMNAGFVLEYPQLDDQEPLLQLEKDDEPPYEDDDDDDEEEEEEDAPLFSGRVLVCVQLILPLFMVFQFNIAFQMGQTVGAMTEQMVMIVIGLFMIASYLYRICLQNSMRVQVTTDNFYCQQVTFLLPEIAIDIVLGLVFGLSAEIGFLALLFATVALSSFVIGSMLYSLCCNRKKDIYSDGGMELCLKTV